MSRTDKDRPYAVRARDPHERTIEYHNHTTTWRHANDSGDCQIDEWLNANIHERSYWRYSCYRTVDINNSHTGHPPRWFIDHTWNAPERTRVRDVLNRARQWYNGGDDLEDFDFPNYQHHHRSSDYWD